MNGVRAGGAGLTLAQNKVLAGHSRKIRDTKDLIKKSTADITAIFEVRAHVYFPSDKRTKANRNTLRPT